MNNEISGTWNDGDNMFHGKWIHRDTGERITITNSLIDENNQMVLMTSIGQIGMDELSKYYIQDSENIDEQQPINNKQSDNFNDNYLLPEDKDILDRKVTPKKVKNTFVEQETPKVSKNKDILDKFFADNKNISLNMNINFNFNEDELKTIMKYTDVTKDDICEYIYENIVNKDNIKKEINNLLLNKLDL